MKIAKFALLPVTLIAGGLSVLNVHAQAQVSSQASGYPFKLTAEAGTTGFGGGGTWRFADHFGVTAAADYFTIGAHASIHDIGYDARLRLLSEPVGFCFYPWTEHSFRINAGIAFNQNKLSGDTTSGSFTVNGNTYNGTLTVNIQQQPISPYASIAGNFLYFDQAKHWSLGGELGCMYTGTPRVGLISSNPAANNDVATEREEVIKYANYAKFWPIVKVGLNFSF